MCTLAIGEFNIVHGFHPEQTMETPDYDFNATWNNYNKRIIKKTSRLVRYTYDDVLAYNTVHI